MISVFNIFNESSFHLALYSHHNNKANIQFYKVNNINIKEMTFSRKKNDWNFLFFF